MHLALLLYISLVNDVRTILSRNDLAGAQRAVESYRARMGATPEFAAALSWVARGQLDAKRFDAADQTAAETRKVTMELLRTRKLDADPWLPTALGASIEVHASVLAAQGGRAEAVAFLREQAAAYANTSIAERIHKDLNLLSLEGKPAPPLEADEWLEAKPPSLASLRGHPVMLVFWAHWCADCKALAGTIASLMKTYGPKGLVLIAPTRRYGYVAGGEEAAPVVEKRYIEQVRQQYYPGLAGVPIPLSAANFVSYGSSTTPTLVLIDTTGIVRYYHPGAATEEELTARIRRVMGK